MERWISIIQDSRLIETMENTIVRQEKEIQRLEKENALLKASSKPQPTVTYTHTSVNPFAKTMCDCIDWRDMQASPFCHKCGGTGSY